MTYLAPSRPERKPRAFRRQAARGLLWAAIAFGLSQAALGVTVRAGWVPVHDLIFADKAAMLDGHPAFRAPAGPDRPLTVLALGSSRPMCGLQCKRLGDAIARATDRPAVAFNFGIPAAGPITSNLYLRRLLADGVRPGFVVVEVLPPFLAGQLGTPMEAKWLQPHRVRDEEFDLLEQWGYHLPRGDSEAWRHWLAGTHAYRSALLSRNLPSWVPYEQLCDARACTEPHGWMRTPKERVTPAEYQKGLSVARKQYRQAFADFHVGGASCAALRDLLALCARERLPVALLLMPEATDFRAWYTPDALAQVDRFLNGLSTEFGVPMVDARRWIADEWFADGHHLLPGGAERFTDRLAEELLQLPGFPSRCVVQAP